MEVKTVYMDLVEWVKKGNVWKLETEVFKKPIELKIWYDATDIKKFDSKIAELKHSIDVHEKQIASLNDDEYELEQDVTAIEKELYKQKETNIDLFEKIAEKWTEISQLYKVIADLKTTVETLSGTILQLQEKNKEITQKLTKQPKVFHDKIFISWNEEVMLGLYDVADWDYLQILNIRIGEHNEYCENKDEVLIDRVHSQDWFTPRYKLFWGTELDTPTGTVYFDLVLIPL